MFFIAQRKTPLVVFILSFFLFIACTSSKVRYQTSNLYSVLKFKDQEVVELLASQYRTGSIYLDFRPVMSIDAIYKDRIYREAYIKEISKSYYFDEKRERELHEENSHEFENYYDFLIFADSGGKNRTNLQNKSNEWLLLLKDYEGHNLQPIKVSKISKNSREFIFLHKYFQRLDRWAEAYYIRFPKLSQVNLPDTLFSIQLILTGIKGQTILQWDEIEMFHPTKHKDQ